ncbi:Lipopolysaccharide-assembly [Parelusimicrobium proximum]|uniref:LPS assembly lipoprotein LptE n=1 Tax=Parelusimicrobium proximum TaxID=3228953 RepID=UPI003D17B216
MKRLLKVFALGIILAGCSQNVIYKPYDQLTPGSITKIAIRPFINRTEVFALEDRLSLELTDEFLKNGQYQIVPEAEADGIIIGQIYRYLRVPLQYDSQLIPTTYRLDIWLRVQLLDPKSQIALWQEDALMGTYTYSAPTLPGGMTEDQARMEIWNKLSRDIVKRTTDGFGAVRSETKKRVQENDTYTTITQ